jgi:hypothetical protein
MMQEQTENLSKTEGNDEGGVFSNRSNTEQLEEGGIPAISGATSTQGKQVLLLQRRIKELERNNRLLHEENSKLQEDIQEVSAQHEKQQQTITSLQRTPVQPSSASGNSDGFSKSNSEPNNQGMMQQQTIDEDLQNRVVGLVEEKLMLQNLVEFLEHQLGVRQQGKAVHPTTSVDPSTTTNNESQTQEMQQTIDLLQQRVIVLVEEKLNLQDLVDVLEHRQVEVQFFNNDESNQQQEPKKDGNKWGVFTKKAKGKESPPIIANTNILKQIIPEQVYDDADDAEVEVEGFDTSRETWAAMKRTTVTLSMLDTMSSTTMETNQAHFLETAMRKKKYKAKAWGQKLGEMLSPPVADKTKTNANANQLMKLENF